MGGVPCGGGAFGAGQNASGILDMRTMSDFYDGGGLDMAVLGLAEVNTRGDINVGRFGPKTPGCGGFINISQNTHKIVFFGSFTSLIWTRPQKLWSGVADNSLVIKAKNIAFTVRMSNIDLHIDKYAEI